MRGNPLMGRRMSRKAVYNRAQIVSIEHTEPRIVSHPFCSASVAASTLTVKNFFLRAINVSVLLPSFVLSSLSLVTPAMAATIVVGNADDHPFGSPANCNIVSTCTLRDAISMAADATGTATGDTIVFDLPANSTITLSSAALFINKNMTIDADSVTGLSISGNNRSPTFQIYSPANVSLNKITIKNGSNFGNSSGSIYNSGHLTLSHINVLASAGIGSNYAANGIYNTGFLSLTDSLIENNSSTGIFNSGTLTMANSTARGNTRQGINSTGTATLTSSTISDTINSSGISNSGTMKIANCTVSGNHGGIDNRGIMTLLDTTVSNNASSRGGGIYNGDAGKMTINGGIITANIASGNFSHAGGIYNSGSLALIDGAIRENTATYGGGIENSGMLIMDRGVVLNNTATEGGGIWNSGDINLNNSSISSNTAGSAAGVENHGFATLSLSTVFGNSSTTGGCGGIANIGIESMSTLTLFGSTVSGNTSENATICNSYGTLTLIDSTLSENSATSGKSGGIHAYPDYYGHGSSLVLIGSTIAGNTAANIASDIYNGALSESLIVNSIIQSCASDGGDTTALNDNGGNLDGGSGCGLTNPTSKSNATLDLGPLADNGGPTWTMLPGANSDAIGFGLPDVCRNAPVNSRDQRGYVRVGCTSGAADPNASANDSIFFDGFAYGGG